MAFQDSKPRPNGPQGKAGKSSLQAPRNGGCPSESAPKASTNLCHPTKAPGSGTRGTGNTAKPPRN